MLPPVRCMNCGYTLGEVWRWYQARVAVLREERNLGSGPIYIDGTSLPDTPERKACDELGITRYCCRKTLLTHRDLIHRI